MTLICIDPGHAASTPGKRSFDGSLREYEFNRAVAKRLAYHLQRHGLKTMYSCNPDQEADASLKSRCTAANSSKADLFISVHANAAGTDWNSAQGWELFYSTGSTKGKALAEAIYARSKSLELVDRGVKEGEWYVIRNTSMPAVLVEHEFMTNRVSVEKLKSAEWREKWAVADAKGILDYLGIQWKEEGTVESNIKDTIITIGNTKVAGKLIDGVTYAPIRELVEALKTEPEVTWDSAKGAQIKL